MDAAHCGDSVRFSVPGDSSTDSQSQASAVRLWLCIGAYVLPDGAGKALFPLGKLMARQLTDPVFPAGCVFRQTGY